MPNYHGASPEQAAEDALLVAFAALAGKAAPDSREAKDLAAKWQAHMAAYHNGCDDAKLRRLADLYGADDRFAEHMDSYGLGTAHFMSEAIEAYLEEK